LTLNDLEKQFKRKGF